MRALESLGPLALCASLVLSFAVCPAHADLELNDPLDVNGWAFDTLGGLATIWGTHGTLGNEGNGLQHLFGGFALFDDDVFSGGGFNIGVSSSEIAPSPGQSFAAEIVIDYDVNFGFLPLGAGYTHSIDIIGIKGVGDPVLIDSVSVNVGLVSTDGFGISWSAVESEILDAGSVVVITWGHGIPEPGVLVLLGLAGFARRRRL